MHCFEQGQQKSRKTINISLSVRYNKNVSTALLCRQAALALPVELPVTMALKFLHAKQLFRSVTSDENKITHTIPHACTYTLQPNTETSQKCCHLETRLSLLLRGKFVQF